MRKMIDGKKGKNLMPSGQKLGLGTPGKLYIIYLLYVF
jgi:hypothetical protein